MDKSEIKDPEAEAHRKADKDLERRKAQYEEDLDKGRKPKRQYR